MPLIHVYATPHWPACSQLRAVFASIERRQVNSIVPTRFGVLSSQRGDIFLHIFQAVLYSQKLSFDIFAWLLKCTLWHFVDAAELEGDWLEYGVTRDELVTLATCAA